MRAEALQRAIEAGVGYIHDHQSATGSWTDWRLPPGESAVWTTAYVGYRLGEVPGRWKARVAGAVQSAARWLLDHQFEDGGWGYNPVAGSDADSTSFAILTLTSAGFTVPASAYEHLLRYQQSDGGFSTFQPAGRRDSWSVSHPDVTPVAARALMTRGEAGEEAVRRAIDRVLGFQTRQGAWNSFWWDSFLYGTEVSLSLLRAAGRPQACPAGLLRMRPAHCCDTALLISALFDTRPAPEPGRIQPWIARLINEQREDGSWPSRPMLRITRRDCFQPWDAPDAGPLYADPHRLFTSATVLHALARAYALF